MKIKLLEYGADDTLPRKEDVFFAVKFNFIIWHVIVNFAIVMCLRNNDKIYTSWGERNTAATKYFGEIVFLQKWKTLSIIQIVTNSYNSSLNGFKDIWH